MADLSDVEIALGLGIQNALYPNGESNPSAVGLDTVIMRGWPSETQVNNAVSATPATALVSVVVKRGVNRLVSHFNGGWIPLPSNPSPTLTVAVADDVATFGGDFSGLPLNLAITAGNRFAQFSINADGTTGNFTIDDMLTSQIFPATGLLGNLLATIVSLFPGASVSGDAVTIPNLSSVRIGTTGQAVREVRRQAQQFQVTVWAPTPLARDAIGKAIDTYFATSLRLAYSDGTGGKIDYVGSGDADTQQNANVLKRDLVYSIEYPTVETQTFADLVSLSAGVTVKLGKFIPGISFTQQTKLRD